MYQWLCCLRSALHMVVMAVTMPIFALLVLIFTPFLNKQRLFVVARMWLKIAVHSLRWICGVQWRITGLEHVTQAERAVVILAKHQSTYETFLIPAILPMPIAYVYKRELNYIPFFGWAMAQLDMIHINRSVRREAFALVAEQGQRILQQGTCVAMFPEGTRIPRGQVGQYKQGGARLALATASAIVPVAIASAQCWPRKGFIKYPGVVDVVFGSAIDSTGQSAETLTAQAQSFIEGEMRRLDPSAYSESVR